MNCRCFAVAMLTSSLAIGSEVNAQVEIPAAVAALLSSGAQQTICNLSGIPRNANGDPAPTDREHRLALYIRCEVSGGDQWVGQIAAGASCCEAAFLADS